MVDGGTGKAIQTLCGESRHAKKHFQNSCYCYYTLTFIITVLKVRTSGYSWMQGSGLLRDQAKKEGRHRFCISQFGFQISNFEFQSDRDPLDKSGSG